MDENSMKRIISIWFVALSSLVLLVHATVPHHHHDGMMCIAAGSCEQHHHADNSHAGHPQNPDGSEHEQPCIAESEYITPRTESETKCKVLPCLDHDFTHLFPVVLSAADLFTCHAEISTISVTYGEHIPHYTLSEVNRFHGLRAPPFMIL